MKTQKERLLNPEPLTHCFKSKCTYPVCHCYDSDIISKEDADRLVMSQVETMLERLKVFLDDLSGLIRNRPLYLSTAQLIVYRKRRARLQKNFNYWKKIYDGMRNIPTK